MGRESRPRPAPSTSSLICVSLSFAFFLHFETPAATARFYRTHTLRCIHIFVTFRFSMFLLSVRFRRDLGNFFSHVFSWMRHRTSTATMELSALGSNRKRDTDRRAGAFELSAHEITRDQSRSIASSRSWPARIKAGKRADREVPGTPHGLRLNESRKAREQETSWLALLFTTAFFYLLICWGASRPSSCVPAAAEPAAGPRDPEPR